MKTSSRRRKLLLGALAVVVLGYGLHHHAAAARAREREAARASGVWVDLIAFRMVPAWFDSHPGSSCSDAVAAFVSDGRRDAWGHPYRFRCARRTTGAGERVLVRSAGPDGTFDTDDDISSAALGPLH
ncbi:MAG TPA: hypothetical protein VMJ10_25775 [Kofleriaceae bacterium]|nr:hypothetical protein [Kofleriaceae bacterium]